MSNINVKNGKLLKSKELYFYVSVAQLDRVSASGVVARDFHKFLRVFDL